MNGSGLRQLNFPMPARRTRLQISGLLLLSALLAGVLTWRASRQAAISLEWTTQSEINLAGFNLYRSDNPAGPFDRVNPDLVPASPDPLAGGSYHYEDTAPVPGRIYYYQLEEVERDGKVNRSKTITARAEGGWRNGLWISALLASAGLAGFVWSALQRPERPSQGRVVSSHERS